MSRLCSIPKSPIRRAVLFGTGVSLVVHAGLIGILLSSNAAGRKNGQPIPLGTSSLMDDPEDQVGPVHVPDVPPKSASIDSRMVQSRIADMVAASRQVSVEERLSELDLMSQRLGSVASDQSLDDLTGYFQRWMGLGGRAAEPSTEAPVAAKVAGPETGTLNGFDIESAQFHDVKRREPRPREYRYRAVLIDASGRTLEIEMTEAEGRDLYELMQRLNGNPLLKKLYRSIAMPLLDSLVQKARDPANAGTPLPVLSSPSQLEGSVP